MDKGEAMCKTSGLTAQFDERLCQVFALASAG